jgi:hypothetical protein
VEIDLDKDMTKNWTRTNVVLAAKEHATYLITFANLQGVLAFKWAGAAHHHQSVIVKVARIL